MLSPPGSNNAKRTFEGLWHLTSKDIKTGEPFTDVQGPKEEVTVAPLEEMDEWESRRLWQHVAKGIREGDFETASREKSKIEVRYMAGVRVSCWWVLMRGVVERAAAEEKGRACGQHEVGAQTL